MGVLNSVFFGFVRIELYRPFRNAHSGGQMLYALNGQNGKKNLSAHNDLLFYRFSTDFDDNRINGFGKIAHTCATSVQILHQTV